MAEEQWKPVTGYEGYYEISDQGNVKSCERKVSGKEGRIDIRRAQSKKTFINKNNGYLVVNLSKEGKNVTYLIHRLMAFAFLVNPDNLVEIDHIDRNKTNNTLSNLRWVSHSANMLNRVLLPKPLGESKQRYIAKTPANTYSVRIPRGFYLGTFETIEEAVSVRDAYLLKGTL
jgi:hypothetical protein